MSANAWHLCLGIVCVVYLFLSGRSEPSQGYSEASDRDRSATNDPSNEDDLDLLERDQRLYGVDGLDGFDQPNHIVANDEPEHRPG